MNRNQRNGLLAAGALVLVLLALLFVPVSFTPTERVPAKVFAARVWTLEHSGRGEFVSRLTDRGAGVSNRYAVHAVDRGDVASFELAPGVGLGSRIEAGDTIGVLTSTRSDRDLAELQALVDVSASEVATFSEGAKASLIEAAGTRLDQVRAELSLQSRIVARQRALAEAGMISVDELERSEQAEVALRGQEAIAEAELEVLRTGSRASERRLAAARLDASRQRLSSLESQREAFATQSPIAGMVTRSGSDSTLVTVKAIGEWIAVVPVPLAWVGWLAEDQALPIEVGATEAEATIVHIDPSVSSLGGQPVVLVTAQARGIPEGTLDGMDAALVIRGPEETLREKTTAAIGSLFTWQTWWSHAPRD